ncbi:MAG: hypothetical protein AUJ85_01335 [Elusimicrobia bacterium CG1_02_37_114]|nr:MAG: hypothetical protein AUJ85_01335 [Elusimicrobia bacterium CG1_02_37_114]PIV52255.1 MAG: hypothetical protein COS17_10190 [Elusimicrobia bacterium CG02_land_8_20_14_3_00_37_13]PIZ13703.1 MAG: hypothetical protein COY53_03560 [Elusimicrobia bacterium CG_4_10_14_0_8_um_filter_37_32]
MKRAFVLLFISFFVLTCFQSSYLFANQKNTRKRVEKRANTAAVFSGLIPGLGQVYNREYGKGCLLFAGTSLGLYLWVMGSPGGVGFLGGILTVTCYYVGIHDAYENGRRIGREEVLLE